MTVLTALTPVLVVLLGGVGWLYRYERERRAAAERQVSERKYQAYIALLNIFFDLLKAQRKHQNIDGEDLVDRMFDANKELALYASDDVLQLYLDWLNRSRTGEVDINQFGELVVAIRRDMGYAKTKITSDDVLRQLILDYDQVKARGGLVVTQPSSRQRKENK